MKKALFVLFVMFPCCLYAQTFQGDGEKYEVYCDVTCHVGIKKSIDITINNEEYVIKDKDGATIKTKDVTSALNLLSKRGWKLVTSSQSQDGTSGAQVMHYIVKKEVFDDREIELGIAKEK